MTQEPFGTEWAFAEYNFFFYLKIAIAVLFLLGFVLTRSVFLRLACGLVMVPCFYASHVLQVIRKWDLRAGAAEMNPDLEAAELQLDAVVGGDGANVLFNILFAGPAYCLILVVLAVLVGMFTLDNKEVGTNPATPPKNE